MRVPTLLLTVLLSIFTIAQAVPENAATVNQCSAPALSQCTLTFNLNNGDKVSGSISVTGGSANDINFYITNPSGAQVYNAGRVNGGTSFSITADSSGAYILHFDNSFSLFSGKQVTLSYDVSSGGGGGIPEFPPQISVVIVVTLLVVASYLVARRLSIKGSKQPSLSPNFGN